MKAVRGDKIVKGRLGAFLSLAAREPVAVLENKNRIHPRPTTEVISFIAMPFATWAAGRPVPAASEADEANDDDVDLGAKGAKDNGGDPEVIDLDQLKHDLSCGYVGYNAQRGRVYCVNVPRVGAVALLSEEAYTEQSSAGTLQLSIVDI